MEYQLVLQFQGDTLEDYDAMVALEEDLIESLADLGEVDGHDVGAGQVNIFIVTTDPLGCFRSAQRTLEERALLNQVSAVYRQAKGEAYTILWPPSARSFAVA